MGTVVSLDAYRESLKPKEAILEFDTSNGIIRFASPDHETVYLEEKYTKPLSLDEFEAAISMFKYHHPQLVCIDF